MAEKFVPSSSTPAATQVNVGLEELRSKAENPTTSAEDLLKALNDGLEWLFALQGDKDNEVSSHITQKDPSKVYNLSKARVSNICKEVFSHIDDAYTSVDEEFEEVGGQRKRGLDDEEKIRRALNKLIKLVEECPEKILVDRVPERVIKEIGVPSIAGSPTLQDALQGVQQALLQTNGPKCVALEGQDCMGKTIIMQHLNNFFYENPDKKKFDVVIFIKVAPDEQIGEDLYILQKIAERMKVNIEGYEFEVARRVRKVLKYKRYLLTLDGIRQPSTLQQIWHNLKISNDMVGSKVVITTHCHWGSRFVDETVWLKLLSPTEAWKVVRERTSLSKSTDAIGESDLGQDLSRLMRTWDFLHLILSYPMRIGYEDFLEQWIYDASQIGLRRGLKHLLYDESPLRYVQAVIPQDIATKIINGGRVSREKPLKQVPQPIILLATHLALHQLTLNLTSDNIPYSRRALEKIQNIWFSARNDVEKRTVVENIQENSQIRATFGDLIIIDLNQIDDQTQREQALLNLNTTRAKSPAKEENSLVKNNYKSRHLVLVVDGDGDKKLDPQKVSLPINRDSENVVVFITALSSARQNDNFSINVDLTINSEDHSLPWELFCKIVGSELLHSSIAIQEIAVQIVEKCGGHLLAIILMAQSLKHVTYVQTWELALKKLRYRAREAIVNAFLFNIIWANVNSEAKKIRLLRCLMIFKFPDWKMTSDDELFDRWFSEQLVDTKEEAKSILKNFMECSLLLQFDDTLGRHNIQLLEDIKIILHALGEEMPENLSEGALESTISELQVLNLSNTHMRNLYAVNTQPHLKKLNLEGCMVETLPEAIFKLQKLETLSLEHCSQLQELPPQIAKLENLRELRLSGCEQLETLPQEIWELPKLEVCYLSGAHIADLPRSLNFPNLRSLLLGNNLNLMKIPSTFFHHVPLLTVIDLSRTSIHELPSSIFNLQQLRELYLKDCELFVELSPEIHRLRELVTLDLEGTLITHLPMEIQELRNLESLSLSFYNDSNHDSEFDVIPYGILTQLKDLEVLRIHVNSDNEWWFNHFDNVLVQISGLRKLRVLDVYIPGDKFRAPIEKSLSNFRFIVGHHNPRMISRVPPAIEAMFKESSRSLKFVNGQDFPDRVKTILSESWAFFLDRHKTIKNLTQFRLKNLKQLRLCILAECNEMHSILDVEEYEADSDLDEFFCMQFLTVFYMKNLRTIINNPIHGNSIFCELKLLALHTCPELITIFTMHSLRNLVNLEELIVEDCPKVSSIVSCPSSKQMKGFFLPKLRKLSLLFVPELTSISNGVFFGRNLEQVGLYYCPKLQSLSTAELSSDKLKVIRAEMEWWKNELKWSKEEWGQEDPPHNFNKIFSPIDEDLDIFTQLTTYELASLPLQSSSATNSSVNNHVDVRTRLGVDDIDISSVDEPLRPSNDEVLKDKKHSHTRGAISTWTEQSESIEDGYGWKKYGQKEIFGAKYPKRDEEEKTLMVPAPQFGNTEIPPDDGFIWRKYGQKEILGSIYPRSYFRCTHQKLCRCPAKKQVQRLDSNPNIFAVTYRGSHTCHLSSTARSSSVPPQLILGKTGEIVTSEALDPSNDKVDKDRRAEGKRSSRDKKEEEEEEADGDEETESEVDSGEEHGRKRSIISNAYNRRGLKHGSSSVVPPCCQADDCRTDLSGAKQYHRRHKVCEYHAEAPVVLISGNEQRFCQQCSRFHALSEFDNSTRSCRCNTPISVV